MKKICSCRMGSCRRYCSCSCSPKHYLGFSTGTNTAVGSARRCSHHQCVCDPTRKIRSNLKVWIQQDTLDSPSDPANAKAPVTLGGGFAIAAGFGSVALPLQQICISAQPASLWRGTARDDLGRGDDCNCDCHHPWTHPVCDPYPVGRKKAIESLGFGRRLRCGCCRRCRRLDHFMEDWGLERT